MVYGSTYTYLILIVSQFWHKLGRDLPMTSKRKHVIMISSKSGTCSKFHFFAFKLFN